MLFGALDLDQSSAHTGCTVNQCMFKLQSNPSNRGLGSIFMNAFIDVGQSCFVSGVTDVFMRKMLRTTKRYTLVILHRTSKRSEPGADNVVWEHGRRNFELRRDGYLCIVGPVVKDETDVTGVCVFSTSLKRTKMIMNEDPAVKAGIFTYEAHLIEGFPGDGLAK